MKHNLLTYILLAVILASGFTAKAQQGTARDKAAALTIKGMESYSHDSLDKALQYFNDALKADSTYDEARLRRANTYYDQKKIQQALIDYKYLVQKHTDRSEVYARVGDILCSEPYASPQHIKQANSFYTIAITIDNTQGSYYASRGMTSFSMGNFDGSLDDFLKAIDLKYTNAEIYAQTGYCYQQLHDFKRAVYYYNKAIDGDPTNVEYFANRGEALLAMHQLEGAVDDFKTYIMQVPDNYQVYYSLARAEYGLQQYDSSISSLHKSLALWQKEADAGNSNNQMGAEIWFRLGLAAADKGDYKTAIDAFNNSLSLSPSGGSANLYYNLAVAKAKADPKSDFCSDLKKAADMGFPDAVKMYANTCVK